MPDKNMEENWNAFADTLLNTCQAVLSEGEVTDVDVDKVDVRTAALALLCRSVNNFAAARALLEQAFVVEARTLVRCCYENLFWIGGLTGKGAGFMKQVSDDNDVSKLKMGRELLRWKRNNGRALEGPLESFVNKLQAEKGAKRAIALREAAETANLGDAYIIYRGLSSDAAHASAVSLSRHVAREGKGDTESITFDGTPQIGDGEAGETLEFACNALLAVCVGTNDLVGGTPGGRGLSALFVEFKELSNKASACGKEGYWPKLEAEAEESFPIVEHATEQKVVPRNGRE